MIEAAAQFVCILFMVIGAFYVFDLLGMLVMFKLFGVPGSAEWRFWPSVTFTRNGRWTRK